MNDLDFPRDSFAQTQSEMLAFVARALLIPPEQDWLMHLYRPEVCRALLQLGVAVPDEPPRLSDVRADFYGLFRVPGSQYVRPYESVWLSASARGLLLSERTADVAEWYRQAGYAPPENPRELPDQLGIETDFAAWLCGRVARAENEDEAQEWADYYVAFVDEHLGPFVERILPEVVACDSQKLYAPLCQLLARVLFAPEVDAA